MKRFNVIMVGLVLCTVVVIAALAWMVRELRQEARHRYYQQLADQQLEEVTITIPEGWRREQIAALLEEKGVTGADDFLSATKDDEGQLFPDTYRFFPSTTANEVRERLHTTYSNKTASLGNVSRDVLVIASIVEREARNDDERAAIAGVYWNRFNAGFGLGADPTVQYGKESLALTEQLATALTPADRGAIVQAFAFWQPITRADYTGVNSPYNTYKITALPPTPICNPGLASITASLTPGEHQYYYFFHTSDGQTIYSKTLDEHNRNKANYL